jgi:hypothetical protein
MRKHSECLESMRIVLLGGCRIDVLLKVESTAHGRLLGRTVTASHQSSFLPSFLPSFFLSSIRLPSSTRLNPTFLSSPAISLFFHVTPRILPTCGTCSFPAG